MSNFTDGINFFSAFRAIPYTLSIWSRMHKNSKNSYLIFIRIFLALRVARFSLHKHSEQLA